jgi:hypothetical protein
LAKLAFPAVFGLFGVKLERWDDEDEEWSSLFPVESADMQFLQVFSSFLATKVQRKYQTL